MDELTYGRLHDALRQAALNVPGLNYYHGPLADRAWQQTANYPLIWVQDDMALSSEGQGLRYTVGITILDVIAGPVADEPIRLDGEVRAISYCEQIGRYILGEINGQDNGLLPEGSTLSWSMITIHRDFLPRAVGVSYELTLQGTYITRCPAPQPPPSYGGLEPVALTVIYPPTLEETEFFVYTPPDGL